MTCSVFRHLFASAVTISIALAIGVGGYVFLIIWALFGGGGLGGPMTLPILVLGITVAAVAGCLFVLLPSVVLAERLAGRRVFELGGAVRAAFLPGGSLADGSHPVGWRCSVALLTAAAGRLLGLRADSGHVHQHHDDGVQLATLAVDDAAIDGRVAGLCRQVSPGGEIGPFPEIVVQCLRRRPAGSMFSSPPVNIIRRQSTARRHRSHSTPGGLRGCCHDDGLTDCRFLTLSGIGENREQVFQ